MSNTYEPCFYRINIDVIPSYIELPCYEYFHITKIIRARNVQTVCNIKPKSWLQILGHGPRLLLLDL